MKKTITVILIVFMLTNLICTNSFAENDGQSSIDENTFTHQEGENDSGNFKPMIDITNSPDEKDKEIGQGISSDLSEGKAEVEDKNGNKTKENPSFSDNAQAWLFSKIVTTITIIPQIANQVMESVVEVADNESEGSKFTIYKTVMGEYELFNIDYNDVPEKPTSNSSINDIFKYYSLKFYTILRNLSIALSLFALIYVGIRMAIANVTASKVKYTKMLYGWGTALLLLVSMHFIIIIISYVTSYVLSIIQDIGAKITLSNTKNIDSAIPITDIEQQIFSGLIQDYSGAKGWNLFSAAFSICILVYYQVKFFIFYISRVLEINFLVAVSPLVTITYPIDAAGDGKAQAFKAWFSELISKATIQIVHATLYIIFIGSAGFIAINHPFLAVLFFTFLSRSEKIVRNIFTLKDGGFEKTQVPFT